MNGLAGIRGHLWCRLLPSLTAALLLAACGGDSPGTGVTTGTETIKGVVAGGEATVCLDLDRDGWCRGQEPMVRTGSSGAFELAVPAGSVAPLVAEVGGAASAEMPWRMASPSAAYSTQITALTTLVHLRAEADSRMAEDLTRSVLGLPPQFAIRPGTVPSSDALREAVSASVTTALKATAWTADWSGPGAFDAVVAALPAPAKELPRLAIVTKDAAPIDSKEVYVDATFALTNPALSSEAAMLNGKIRGRGNSTWGAPKNPYKVQLTNDAAYAKVTDLLGMKKNRNWALLADWFDRSLLRNKLAFSLGSSPVFAEGLKWTPSGQHVEVTLNGDYVGVYLLTEDIRIAPERLDVRVMSSKPADQQLDGGYIVEVDARLDCYSQEPTNLQHVTPRGTPICVARPDEGSITTGQLAWIKAHLDQVEGDISGPGDLARIDSESFADWYLLNELFRTNDAIFWSSVFLWKDSESAANPRDRRLHLGPLWDFDRSAGNINYNGNWMTEGCWVARPSPVTYSWIAVLLQNPDFVRFTIARWKAKRPALEHWLNASLDQFARRLEPAQQRNFTRWPILGTPMTSTYTFPTHAGEVAFLRRFLNERMVWLDKAFESPEAFRALCQ